MNKQGITPPQFCGHPLSPLGTLVFDEIFDTITTPVTYTTGKRVSHGEAIFSSSGVQITISNLISSVCFEETLLHELYHIVQYENGFPDLKTISADDQKQHCTIIVSSLVLDLDVARFLSNKKIKLHKDMANQQYQMLKKKAESLASPKFSPQLNHVEMLDYAALYANLYLTFNKQKGRYLVDVFSRIAPTVRSYFEQLISVISSGDPFSSIGCVQIFSKLAVLYPFMGWHIEATSSQSM